MIRLIELAMCHQMTPLLMLYMHYLDLNFQGHNFETLTSRKRCELAPKMSDITRYKDFGIRMASLRILHFVTLTEIFKVTNLKRQ